MIEDKRKQELQKKTIGVGERMNATPRNIECNESGVKIWLLLLSARRTFHEYNFPPKCVSNNFFTRERFGATGEGIWSWLLLGDTCFQRSDQLRSVIIICTSNTQKTKQGELVPFVIVKYMAMPVADAASFTNEYFVSRVVRTDAPIADLQLQ